DGEGSHFGIVGPDLFAIVHGGVRVALGLVGFLDALLGFGDARGIHNRPRMYLHRGDNLVVGGADLLHTDDFHIGDLGPFGDPVDQDFLAALIARIGGNILKKAHLINGLDVVADRVAIEWFAGALRDMEADGVALDALVTF